MKPVYLVTCRPEHEPQLSREDDGLLQQAFVAQGIACKNVVWSDSAIRWETLAEHAQAVIVRSTWDYFLDRERFLEIMETVSARTILLNSLEVMRWNTHKGYLEDLRAVGLPTIPTVWISSKAAVIAHLCEQYGWTRAVLKPAVSTNAYNTLLFESSDSQRAQQHLERACSSNGMLLQPFYESVTTLGEHSLVFIDGVFSHAFRKQAALQRDHTGEHPVPVTSAEIALGKHALCAVALLLDIPDALPFARVDLVQDGWGQWTLMELELVEPRLRLSDSATAVQRLCTVILQRIAAQTKSLELFAGNSVFRHVPSREIAGH